jgi:hypothetical protein
MQMHSAKQTASDKTAQETRLVLVKDELAISLYYDQNLIDHHSKYHGQTQQTKYPA